MKPFPALLTAALGLSSALAAAPALTVYNQGFAVVRDTVALDLKAGVNSVSFGGVTAEMEPDSVVLRDPAGKHAVGILEQSYRAETLSEGMMLRLNEGKTITFLVADQEGREHPVKGKIVRSGFGGGGRRGGEAPIIEVDGGLRFSLPGKPVFPALADDAVLKPTLSWQLRSETPQKFDAELSYVTGGLSWEASYNFVTPEEGGAMEVTGWVTVENTSGADFRDAAVKLMAGEVNKIKLPTPTAESDAFAAGAADPFGAPEVTEKAFDEFHLYQLPRPVTLRNRETKQVEFIRASGVASEVIYLYDGSGLGDGGLPGGEVLREPGFGVSGNTKVNVFREFRNSKENNLGLPLPQGMIRFYREDSADKRVEFTGENTIGHTAQGELVRLRTGDAFDLVGERKQTAYQLSNRQDQADETFEIRLRNRKKQPVEIRVIEHLYRGQNWNILEKSQDFTKTDATTIEFRVKVAPDEEKVLTYKVRYDWK